MRQKAPPPAGTSRSVALASGGTLTVSASMDVFGFSPDDRTFVFDLIDKLLKYEKDNPSPPKATSDNG